MNYNFKINIADITFLLIAKEGSFKLRNNTPYCLFSTKKKPEVILKFYNGLDSRWDEGLSRRAIFDTHPNWRLSYVNNRYVLETRDRTMVMAPDFTSGEVYILKNHSSFPFGYPLDEILMINLLGKKRGILLHGCGIKNNNGSGVLFVGTSGAGKSTMANLYKTDSQATILSDDRVIIRNRDDHFLIYGTPWHGDARLCSSERATLKKIFFLKHAKKNSIRRIEPFDAVSCLIACSFPTFWNKKGMEFTLKFCSQLTQKVACYELGFLPDKSILEFIRTLRNEMQ